MPGPVLISCEALTKAFTSRALFENLSFTIHQADVIALVDRETEIFEQRP